MAIFKKTQKDKKKKVVEPVSDVPAYGEEEKPVVRDVEKTSKKEHRKIIPSATGSILKKPWVSEKATDLQRAGQYVFLVDIVATKNEVKKEIGRRYDVKVRTVNIIRMQGKRKRFRGQWSRRPRFKKAIVTLREGEKIEVT